VWHTAASRAESRASWERIQANGPWTVPSPSSTGQGDFLKPPQPTYLAAVDPVVPPPPPTAPAAGGWGNTESRCVYSVGFARTSVGGALEAVARPVWCLVAALSPFDGGVLWSSDVERPLSPCPQLLGAAGRALPWPDLGRWIRRMKMKKKMVLLGSLTMVASEVGPLGPALVDFPFAGGLLPFQGDKRSCCDGAPPTASWCRRGRLAEGLGCNFLSLWTFL
jgi:hypothetical protein